MKTKLILFAGILLLVALLYVQPGPGLAKTQFQASTTPASNIYLPIILNAVQNPLVWLSITLGTTNVPQGITLGQGGDVDTTVVPKGIPPVETRATGNGQALPSSDGNTIPDNYMQFYVDDGKLFQGQPTSRVRVEVDYFDSGTDTFGIQYDAQAGLFMSSGTISKTNTNTFKTAIFNLCGAYFGNRDNGADFRITDNGDGAEYVQAVRVIGLPAGIQNIRVDSYGANPWDTKTDSTAIQAALDASCSGDTITFTSGIDTPGYHGYLIDKTLFLTGMSAKQNLTFTSSDPSRHALLQATGDLKGFVVRLFARSRVSDAGDIDNINFGNIDVNGARDVRKCTGPDDDASGADDNWGSWLPECTTAGDSWCTPGNIALDGGMDTSDPTQNYLAHPSTWSTGIVIHDVVDQQAECGTALGFSSAAGTIQNVTIDTAGDHVHGASCTHTDGDNEPGDWSDGITLVGPAQTVTGNHIINPSDVGIVSFGGKNTVISNNTLEITSGNHGAFAGIAIHPWQLGDVSGMQITGNQVTNAGDNVCGGLHAGINIGPQMWEAGCVGASSLGSYGNNGSCTTDPSSTTVGLCTGGICQIWAYLPVGSVFTLKNNTVTGAQINYLIDGFDALGQFIDQNNVSHTPQLTDWEAAKAGCQGVTWGALDKVAHALTFPGYTDVNIHCER